MCKKYQARSNQPQQQQVQIYNPVKLCPLLLLNQPNKYQFNSMLCSNKQILQLFAKQVRLFCCTQEHKQLEHCAQSKYLQFDLVCPMSLKNYAKIHSQYQIISNKKSFVFSIPRQPTKPDFSRWLTNFYFIFCCYRN